MRDASSYEERALNCLRAVMEDSAGSAELLAQLDVMDIDDIRALASHAEQLAQRARREWLNRTTRPADG